MQMARGESKVFTFTCVDGDGEPIDLSGATIAFTVTNLEGETVISLADTDDEVTVTDDEGGVFTVDITAEQSDLEPGARWADCTVVTGAGQTLRVAEHEPFYVTGT